MKTETPDGSLGERFWLGWTFCLFCTHTSALPDGHFNLPVGRALCMPRKEMISRSILPGVIKIPKGRTHTFLTNLPILLFINLCIHSTNIYGAPSVYLALAKCQRHTFLSCFSKSTQSRQKDRHMNYRVPST